MLVCGHTLYHDCLEKSNRGKQKTCRICFVDNEGPTSAEVQDVDMIEAVEGESEETSNLTGASYPRSETKSIESEKVQGLIKELSMPHEPIDDNNRENKTGKSKPKTLLQLYYNASRAKKYVTRAYQEEIRCWYLFAEKFEER
ncbi:27733_t:CDS:2, partial [Dentiscutata erythropus]